MGNSALFLALTRARKVLAADYEAAATAGDIPRRDAHGRAIDALTEIMGNADVLALVAKEIEKESPHDC